MDEIEQEFANFIGSEEGPNQQVLDDRDVMNELFGDPEPFGEEAEEAPERTIKMINVATEDDVTKVQKPKRVMLKLDLEKLFSDRGLSAIPNHINPLKMKGKGHELEDITAICRAYEHWAHRLYPKMTFKDVLEKIEHLGLKNRKKCFNKKLEIYENARHMAVITGKDGDDEDDVTFPDFPEEEGISTTMFGELPEEAAEPAKAPPPAPQALTEEQLERMRQNRLRALQKKKERDSGVGGSKTLEMSPLARTEEPPTISHDQSSDSDCQAPSKRFKPNYDSTDMVPLTLSQNLSDKNPGENSGKSVSDADKENQMRCSNNSSESVTGKEPMTVEDSNNYQSNSPMAINKMDNTELNAGIPDVSMSCQENSDVNEMTGVDADIARQIESLID